MGLHSSGEHGKSYCRGQAAISGQRENTKTILGAESPASCIYGCVIGLDIDPALYPIPKPAGKPGQSIVIKKSRKVIKVWPQWGGTGDGCVGSSSLWLTLMFWAGVNHTSTPLKMSSAGTPWKWLLVLLRGQPEQVITWKLSTWRPQAAEFVGGGVSLHSHSCQENDLSQHFLPGRSKQAVWMQTDYLFFLQTYLGRFC